MNRNLNLELGNFVLKYNDKNLLDVFEEHFVEIFGEDLDKGNGETYKYTFTDIEFHKILNQPCMLGRIVKCMKIQARQRLQANKRIVSSNDSILSDPSSIFVLRLTDHRLFLIKEIPRSPDLKNFETVVGILLDQEWRARYYAKLARYKRKLRKVRITKEERAEFEDDFLPENPKPYFRLTPISDPLLAAEIVDKFAVIKSLQIKAFKTNNEDVDSDEEFLKKHREKMEKINGDSGEINFKSKEGLDKEEVNAFVEAVSASSGNASFAVKGVSEDGSAITRSERDNRVKLTISVPTGATLTTIAQAAFEKLNQAINQGLLKVNTNNISEETVRHANQVFNSMRNRR